MNLERLPLVRARSVEDNFNYYLLSADEADQLMLLTDDLVDRANKIMMRVMAIQDVLAMQYIERRAAELEPQVE